MSTCNISTLRSIHLRGPNIWTYRPVIEAWIQFDGLQTLPAPTMRAAYERLCLMVPTLTHPGPGIEASKDAPSLLASGFWSPHLLEHLTLVLQQLAGMPGGFGQTRATSQPGLYKVVVRAWHETVTRQALAFARTLILSAIKQEPVDVNEMIDTLHDLRQRYCLGPSTACIVDAADDRDIPAIRLSAGNLLQLGYGVNQRRIWTAETDNTGAIAETISRDKDLTKSLLQACGVPVPVGREVESPADAWEAAQSLGLPVVVKPSDGNHGRGVFTNLSTKEEIDKAYSVAIEEGSGVIVEKFIRGNEIANGHRQCSECPHERLPHVVTAVETDEEHVEDGNETCCLRSNRKERRNRGGCTFVGIGRPLMEWNSRHLESETDQNECNAQRDDGLRRNIGAKIRPDINEQG